MQWFRFYSEALDDPKVQRLPGDLFKAWVNLLCLANEQEERGTLPLLDDIAFRLRLDHQKAEDALSGLRRAGLLEHNADTDEYRIHAWDKRQYASDVSTDRVRKFREKQRETATKRERNKSETFQKRSSNAIDTDTEQIQSQIQIQKQSSLGVASAPRQTPPPRPVRTVPKPKDEPAPKNPWWDALVAGIGVTPTTDQERQLYGKTVRELRSLDADPDEILRRCAHYRARFPNAELTPTALMKHWSRVEHPPPEPVPLSGRNGRRMTVEERNLELFHRMTAEEHDDEPHHVPEAIDVAWHSDEQGTQPRPLRPVVEQVRRAPR